jgi:hypothetical protein
MKKERSMKFSLLLFALYHLLKRASKKNEAFKKYIGKTDARILIKTKDGKRGRLFVFNKGNLSSLSGDHQAFDVALVWADAATGFAVMTDKKKDASFNAAAEGKLTVYGMSVYAQWFEEGTKLVL